MKMNISKRRVSFMGLFLMVALAGGLHTSKVHAQDDMLDEADDSLNMDTMDIDGHLSPSERMRRQREKLEARNVDRMNQAVEKIRTKQELEMAKKLQHAFDKSLNALDEDKVTVTQAAPVAPQPVQPTVVETRIVEVEKQPIKEEKKSKVIPYIGASAIKGDKIDFESKMNVGADLETFVLPNVSVGIGLGYTSLDITDIANDFINQGSVYNPGYYNAFGTGRKMSFNKFAIEASGKFFLTVENKIKPYVGAGLSYNRSNLKYDDGGNGYTQNGINYGSEGLSSSAMGAKAKLGAEIDFSDTVGLNVDLSYAKNLSSGLAQDDKTTTSNPDQQRLRNITKSIEDSDVTTIAAGLVVRF